MKVSINLAQEYANVDIKSIPRDELLRRIGAQLGAVEDVTEWAAKFEGAVIVRIVSCEKHPDADKLSVCRIDDGGMNQSVDRGEDGLIQVVCGAPNARTDMFAIWLSPGVIVPSTRDTDPFVLEAREIRGVMSSGMLASASELGISDDHAGIVEVTAEDAGKEPAPGEPLTSYFGLDDFVVDCENKMFTHRPDCFGVLGVARELAGISGLAFESPDWYLRTPQFEDKNDLQITVKNDIPEFVPRFMAVAMQGVTVKPSPMWLQAALTRVGIKPVNNVVDATNYVMHLTGQPLHAFDYDKIKERSEAPGIFPRMSKKGEKIKLLGGKEIELTGEEIVISTDKQAVALAGVMGGIDTEVDMNTKNIIIECATFDMYSIRRTSMRYGLFTDAVTRYTKGQSPLQNDRVLVFAMQKMAELTGARQVSKVHDFQDTGVGAKEGVEVAAEFINSRLGTELSSSEIATILQNVEFDVEVATSGELRIVPPFWRMDIKIPEDIVEEIGRLYGYDKLPVALPRRTAKPAPKNELLEFKQQLRLALKQAGANEVLTYSFVHGNLLDKVGQDKSDAYRLSNALSPDLQYYRLSLLPSLLDKVHSNIKAGYDEFGIFELNPVHAKNHVDEEDGLPREVQRLAFVFAASDKMVSAGYAGAPYYHARKYLTGLLADLGIIASFEPLASQEPETVVSKAVVAPFEAGRAAYVKSQNGTLLGVLGEFRSGVRSSLKLPSYIAGFELDTEQVMHEASKQSEYVPLPRFPKVSQDISLKVPADLPYATLFDAIWQALGELQPDSTLPMLGPIDIYQGADDPSHKHVTFRFTITSYERTLTTEEVAVMLDRAAERLRTELSAERI